VLIPRLDQFSLMLANDSLNLIQFVCSEPKISSQFNRVKPELGLVTFGFDMNMGWLLSFVAEESKPITSDP